jgi:hypothetical protein
MFEEKCRRVCKPADTGADMPVLSHLRLAGSESVINQVNGFVYIGCQLSPIVCR